MKNNETSNTTFVKDYMESNSIWLFIVLVSALAFSFAGYSWSKHVNIEEMLINSSHISNMTITQNDLGKMVEYMESRITTMAIVIPWLTVFGNVFIQTVCLASILFILDKNGELFDCIKLASFSKFVYVIKALVCIILVRYVGVGLDKPFHLVTSLDLGSLVYYLGGHRYSILFDIDLFGQLDLMLTSMLAFRVYKCKGVACIFYLLCVVIIIGKAIVIN